MAERDLVVHGHFYQPPREDPWTDEVAREEGAAPFHDWNERIHAECYGPNAAAGNFSRLSFDVGPTLADWLARRHPDTLSRMVDGDREAAARLGHGAALAHPWVHLILPLADPLDRATVLRWGLAEFRQRFDREPEGFWLPETAADGATLAALVEHGLRFTVLAPQQAARVRPPQGEWQDVVGGAVDPGRAYRWPHPDGSGRALALYFYDGPLAQAVAFGDALASAENLSGRFAAAAAPNVADGLVHLAVDGETFGHHRRGGERVVAAALRDAAARGWRLTNYARHLAENPPTWEVEIDRGPLGEGSSWSCAHGLSRWHRDCGCRFEERPGWSQAWREPLRAALDLLRDRARGFFLDAAGDLLRDPWRARDAFVGVLLEPAASRSFLDAQGRGELHGAAAARALGLLAMQRHLLLMYSSCGWFFDDLAGREGVLVLRQAARALDWWRELGGSPPMAEFLDALSAARCNLPEEGDGADVFRRHARPPGEPYGVVPLEVS